MKTKLLTLLIVFLVLVNGALLFLVLKKPHIQHPPEYIAKQLSFTPDQLVKFNDFEVVHKEKMRELGQKITKQKKQLFNSFHSEGLKPSSMFDSIGTLSALKEKEVYLFFQKIKNICTASQLDTFETIINRAIHQKGNGQKGMPPPPRRN